MRKMLMSGLMLLMMFSCATRIRDPQPVYVINSRFGSVAYGLKSFDHHSDASTMGEWVSNPKLIKWSEMPENVIGFPLEIWLKKIKPVLKEMARKRRDEQD